MRALVHQLLGESQDAVIVLVADHVLEVLDPRGGVHLLGHDQRLGIEIERHHGVRAGRGGGGLHVALRGFEIGASVGNSFDVFVGGSATAADQSHTVLGDELLVIFGQFLRLQGVHCVATDVLRKPGVRKNGNRPRRVRTQIANAVVHLLGTGGAVHADDGDIEHFQRSERRTDFSAQQHGARGFQRDLHLHGNILAGFLQRVEDADQSGLRLQNVLTSFEQQHIHAAVDQRNRLLSIGGSHVVETDMSQRRQLGGRSHRSCNEALASVRGVARRDLARQLGCGQVDLVNLMLHVVLGHHDAGRTEGIGLHHIGSGVEILGVDFLDDVGTAQHQDVVVAVLAPELIERKVVRLDSSPHGAVIDDDAFLDGFEKIAHLTVSQRVRSFSCTVRRAALWAPFKPIPDADGREQNTQLDYQVSQVGWGSRKPRTASCNPCSRLAHRRIEGQLSEGSCQLSVVSVQRIARG